MINMPISKNSPVSKNKLSYVVPYINPVIAHMTKYNKFDGLNLYAIIIDISVNKGKRILFDAIKRDIIPSRIKDIISINIVILHSSLK